MTLTLVVAATATALIAAPGVAIAWLLARRRFTGRSALDTIVNLPLVLPPTTIGFALLFVFGRNGPLGAPLGRIGVDVAFTAAGAILAAAVVSFPLLVRGVRTALEEIDSRYLGLARSLGARPLRVFFSIELPLAWRGVVAGLVLAFARALGEFGATVLIAGNIPGRTQTLALAIFQRLQVGADREALRLAGISALVAFVCLFVVERLASRRSHQLEEDLP